MSSNHNQTIAYRPEIDGLRAIAVLPVVFFHAGFDLFSGGFVGVDVFFVISGFLITSIILREIEQGHFSIIRFYERRARRILPALFFVIACCLPFVWLWMLPYQTKDFFQSIISTIFFFSNILFWKESDYFGAAAELKPLLHTWSLSVEEQFYLFFPPLLFFFHKLGKRNLFIFLVFAIILSLLMAEWGWRHAAVANFFLLPTRAWELGLGCLAAWLYCNRQYKAIPFGAPIGLAMILGAMLWFTENTPTPSAFTLIPVFGSVLVILSERKSTLSSQTLNFLSSRVAVKVGLYSYSIYLVHQPVFAFSRLRGYETHTIETFLICFLIIAAVSLASFHFIENPFRTNSWKGRYGLMTNPVLLVSSVFFLLLVSGLGIRFDGFVHRFDKDERDLVTLNVQEEGRRIRETYWNQYQNIPFSENGKSKLLLIGDSYSQDFLNALLPTGQLDKFEISVHHVKAQCGNLFIPPKVFKTNIPQNSIRDCEREGWNTSKDLQLRLEQADVVILASEWRPWVVDFIPDSLANLRDITDATVIVIGTKHFGSVKPLDYLEIEASKRTSVRQVWPAERQSVNEQMKKLLVDEIFVDYTQALCEGSYKCPVFTPNGILLTHDGHHLRVATAPFVGEKLLDNTPLGATLDKFK